MTITMIHTTGVVMQKRQTLSDLKSTVNLNHMMARIIMYLLFNRNTYLILPLYVKKQKNTQLRNNIIEDEIVGQAWIEAKRRKDNQQFKMLGSPT